jgi:ppGpp synthetase/RelA/SpoT-type nucleotidyltranferase
MLSDDEEILLDAFKAHEATKKAVTDDLELTLKKVSESTKTYTFKSRLKPAPSIARKVLRKRQEGRDLVASVQGRSRSPDVKAVLETAEKLIRYEPRHVTDVYGFRYVTLYQSDIPVIVAELLRSLEEYNERLKTGEEPIRPIEFVVYTNRPLTDPLSIASRTLNLVRQSSFAKLIQDGNIRPPESRKSAYSSVHFVFARSVFSGFRKTDEVEATMEIQIRDIFEEGWGEVQHHLLYSEKDKDLSDLLDGAEPGKREQWELHLNALKTFVDGCGQHASIIKRNLEDLRAAATPTAQTQSVSELDEDREQVQLALRRRNTPKEAIDAVTLGYGLLLSDDPSGDHESRLANLEAAASAFDRALSALNQDTLNQPTALAGGRPVSYFLRMEAASSRTRSAAVAAEMIALFPADAARIRELEAFVSEKRDEAKKLYEAILVDSPDDPVAAMRIGKLLSSSPSSPLSLEMALTHFDEAIRSVDADAATGPQHWIAISVRIDKGLALWRLAKHASSPPERMRLLTATFDITLEAYRVWRGQSSALHEANKITGHKAGSNAIYFLAERVENGHVLDATEKDLVRGLIDYIESLGVENYSDYYKTVDNIMRGYVVLGEAGKARVLAFNNYKTLRRKAEYLASRPLDGHEIATYLRHSALDCFSAAQRVLAAP